MSKWHDPKLIPADQVVLVEYWEDEDEISSEISLGYYDTEDPDVFFLSYPMSTIPMDAVIAWSEIPTEYDFDI